MFTLAILVFPLWIYAQIYEDQIYIDTTLPDVSMPNLPSIYTEEMFDSDIIEEVIYDAPPTSVTYSPNIFGMRTNSLHGSFSQDASWNLRNNFGFSLGAQEGYYSGKNSFENNSFSDPETKQSSSATSLSANVFTNYTRGKSAMHLDYGIGYRLYAEESVSRNNANHNVSAAYVYMLGRSARFQISDSFSTYSNDPYDDVFSTNSSFERLLTGSSNYDIILERQRYSRNSLTSSISFDLTGKGTNVRIFSTYNNYWYERPDSAAVAMEDYYSATIGVGLNQRINKWLSLGTSYSIQLNDDLEDKQIHRVEIGSFQFDLASGVQVYASGGVNITEDGDGDYRVRATTNSGINYSTETSSLYANYTKSMMSLSSSRQSLPSDTVLVGFGQKIGERTNFRAMWYYQLSSGSDDTKLSAHQGQVSIERIIISGLFASLSYTYRYQENSISSVHGASHSERSTISGGLQYVWPSGRR